MIFLHTEVLLGSGASPEEWGDLTDAGFRFRVGAVSKLAKARAKWNVIGSALKLWSPRGPQYGIIEVRVDGQTRGRIDLHSENAVPSQPVWAETGLPDTFHAVVLIVESDRAPLDSLEVSTGR